MDEDKKGMLRVASKASVMEEKKKLLESVDVPQALVRGEEKYIIELKEKEETIDEMSRKINEYSRKIGELEHELEERDAAVHELQEEKNVLLNELLSR